MVSLKTDCMIGTTSEPPQAKRKHLRHSDAKEEVRKIEADVADVLDIIVFVNLSLNICLSTDDNGSNNRP